MKKFNYKKHILIKILKTQSMICKIHIFSNCFKIIPTNHQSTAFEALALGKGSNSDLTVDVKNSNAFNSLNYC
ncbi:hypothetical protein BpHYR1_034455 [Brachionus plicatilis]|uniref:Uncharacterized protein n=1 Tax=Brachionus plicatilis TaxID=10195 RepID=A0A3M7SBT9_BRAPC|nr:hypothetical protein BpHYR1_034455 [Brachionus plicatilis]